MYRMISRLTWLLIPWVCRHKETKAKETSAQGLSGVSQVLWQADVLKFRQAITSWEGV